jgi:hypothetical protein
LILDQSVDVSFEFPPGEREGKGAERMRTDARIYV